ncbi:hypothetical protein QFC24_006076 [Naganishia onofrii]|uniref:Uncharacterized protein n=1 Tax=Naganishia onofrii TaxID=1851511 RepID=A0ACC2X7Y4_9TREE|nr:hypothetical protein QFC24_006076 [Naganishia onofrii]
MGAWSDISAEFTRFLATPGPSRPPKRKLQDLSSGAVTKRPRVDTRNGGTQSIVSRGKAGAREKSSRNTQTIVLDDDDDDENEDDGDVALNDKEDDINGDANHGNEDGDDDEDEVYALPPSGQTQLNLVSCPACGRSIPFSTLNLHLDRSCRSPPVPPPPGAQSKVSSNKSAWAKLLSGPGGGDDSSTATISANHFSPAVDMTRKISKPNYHLASPKELRAVLETYGCSSVGEKAVLIERVQLWISIFNSNLDASHPKPLKTLRAELNEQERAKARDKDDAQKAKQVFATIRHADDDDEAFKRLEADLRERRKSGKNSRGQESRTTGM